MIDGARRLWTTSPWYPPLSESGSHDYNVCRNSDIHDPILTTLPVPLTDSLHDMSHLGGPGRARDSGKFLLSKAGSRRCHPLLQRFHVPALSW
jgi:hypothetical protein